MKTSNSGREKPFLFSLSPAVFSVVSTTSYYPSVSACHQLFCLEKNSRNSSLSPTPPPRGRHTIRSAESIFYYSALFYEEEKKAESVEGGYGEGEKGGGGNSQANMVFSRTRLRTVRVLSLIENVNILGHFATPRMPESIIN